MNDWTRREFLNSAAGAAISSAMIGHTRILNGATADATSTSAPQYAGPSGPLDSVIFPKPQEISSAGGNFIIDSQVRIVVPPNASKEDLFLARSLANELGDRFDLHLQIERTPSIQAGARVILMGSLQNPLTRQYWSGTATSGDQRIPGPEGYILRTGNNVVLVAGQR